MIPFKLLPVIIVIKLYLWHQRIYIKAISLNENLRDVLKKKKNKNLSLRDNQW
jgi:hypothetical protein